MKEKLPLIIVILVLIGVFSFEYWSQTNGGAWITDHEFLYEMAIDYIVKEKTEQENTDYEFIGGKDYKVFTDYEGFGIQEKGNYRYVYMWILEESYYVRDEKLYSMSGSSMAYKFKFKIDGNDIVEYENPEDGSLYTKSIKEMFPSDIVDKVLAYTMSNDKITKEIHSYYSYLPDTKVYLEGVDDIDEDGPIPVVQTIDEPVVNEVTNTVVNEVENTNTVTNTYDYKKFTPNELDKEVFVVDFENYKPDSSETKITTEEASTIAQKGFDESKKRIAGEGADDVLSEKITLEEVSANNYFTRTYFEGDMIYKDLKRNAYVVKRENEMGNGIKVYVDATTGLIIGGDAFGD
ncbi:MAG: hypothetical protein IKN74_01290 [Clostridia bacterium]|nr:hypothetical protein [Bacilli bacterium]MBR3511578.1 hypothetical protein [Clostridia bacterium]